MGNLQLNQKADVSALVSMLIQGMQWWRKEHHRCSYFIHPNYSASEKSRKASSLSPSSAVLEQAEESKGLKEKASNCFWALPPPQWLHQGILISCPSTSSHVPLAQIKNLWTYVSPAWFQSFKQPCLFFEGQSLSRVGVLDVQVNISKISLSSDIWGSHIFKCKFAFY